MNKRQTRSFALISTAIAAIVFLGMTVDSHRQFPKLTNAQQITPEVTRGKDVWHEYNCINCHTLFGEGAYYAPDLTKITQQRGTPYLTAFLKDPSKFYDEQRHRRLMPNLKLNDEEIAALIAFMDWVSKVDNQGWPPRPILVTGTSIPGMDLTVAQQNVAGGNQPPAARPVSDKEDPIALGEALFEPRPHRCAALVIRLHRESISPDRHWPGWLLGPNRSLPRLTTRARPRTSKASSANPSSRQARTCIRATCIPPMACLSCRTPSPNR